jgi:uncharacterized membrane protein YgcG
VSSRRITWPLALVVLFTGVRPCAAPERLPASWATQPATVDGQSAEWAALSPLADSHVSVGVENDGQYLYLVVSTSDQARRQQLAVAGLDIWFDAAGGKKRAFGIRVPGVAPGSMARTDRRDDPQRQVVLPPLAYFEILGPKDDDRRRIDRTTTRAIQIERGFDEGLLALELQVPLMTNDGAPYAIGARSGQLIGLGFETPKIERPEELPPDARGGRGGRGGFGRGGHGGGGGRRGGGGEMQHAERLNVWTTVQLAAR